MAGHTTWVRGGAWSVADQSPHHVAVSSGALDMPFPQCPRTDDTRDRRGLPRYLARRIGGSAGCEHYLAVAVASLNALSLARWDGRLEVQLAHRVSNGEVLPLSYHLALRPLWSALAGARPQPLEHDVCARGALSELLQSTTIYYSAPPHVTC